MEHRANIGLFNFNYNNRLSLSRIVVVDAYDGSMWQIRWWLNGRVLGRYVSVNIPWVTCLMEGKSDDDPTV